MTHTPPATPEPAPTDPVLDRAERRLARLSRVADLAEELAQALQARALAALRIPDDAEAERRAAVFTQAFDRAARAVHLCSRLEARLEDELGPRRQAAAEARKVRAAVKAKAEEQARLARRTPEEVRSDTVRDVMERAISTAAETGREHSLMQAKLYERLDSDRQRFQGRPVGAVVSDLCEGLAIAPDWDAWEEEPWALHETLTRAEGSPYADWPLPGEKEDEVEEPELDPDTAMRVERAKAWANKAAQDARAAAWRLTLEQAANDERLREAYERAMGP